MNKLLTEHEAWLKVADYFNHTPVWGICSMMSSMFDNSTISHNTYLSMCYRLYDWGYKNNKAKDTYFFPLDRNGHKQRVKLALQFAEETRNYENTINTTWLFKLRI